MWIKTFLIPKRIQELKKEFKEKGAQEFIKSLGWKVVLAIIIFYLIRDSFLYLLLPYLIAKGLFF
ncbi:MAG: hypothetical protein DWQ05_15660 [Calditrichaeota bacterium]|nr:MAG: hypothetical protein DWQ05_15660 [Calditrichota bacterium]